MLSPYQNIISQTIVSATLCEREEETYRTNTIYKHDSESLWYFFNNRGFLHFLRPKCIAWPNGEPAYWTLSEKYLAKSGHIKSAGDRGRFASLANCINYLNGGIL